MTMMLNVDDKYINKVENFIASLPQGAVEVKNSLDDEIAKRVALYRSDNPYLHRKRPSLNDDNVRELIHKGYTVPFEIDTKNTKIIILGIFKQNLWQ